MSPAQCAVMRGGYLRMLTTAGRVCAIPQDLGFYGQWHNWYSRIDWADWK